MMPEEITSENRDCLKLYIYNTDKKAKHELATFNNGPGPDDLLQTFMHTLRQCHRLKYFVGTAIYTPASGHVYLSSDDDNWTETVCANEIGQLTDSANIISGDPFYPEGRFISLDIYNTAEGTAYKSTVPRDSFTACARLLRRFLVALEYCNGNGLAIKNAIYTDDAAFINVSVADAAWAQGLERALQGLP